MSGVLYQHRKTGKRVRLIGSHGGKEEFVLVKGNEGPPFHALLSQLIPCDDSGRPDFDAVHVSPDEPEETIPQPLIDLPETRININTVSAEELAKRVPGIGYRVAKRIKQLQLSQPGEVFRSLEQVEAASARVNWEEIMRANLIYIG
ncbi:MAG: helix-hairpin-helix domain-containing protein [Prochlorococcaceae cyanobacterium]